MPRKQHLLLALGLVAAHALAAEPAPFSRDLVVDSSKEAAQSPRLFEDVVIAPIPISNPTVGTGAAVVVMPFYKLGEDSPLSNTSIAAGLVSSGSWGVAAAQSTRLRDDRLRVDGFLGYVEVHYRFYGAGADAGQSGESVPIVQKGVAFAPELLWQVGGRTFLGLRYRGVRIETAVEGSTGPTTSMPRSVLDVLPTTAIVVSSGFGPRATYDTRDNDMNPARGMHLDLRANFADQAFGSDLTYQTYEVSANHYRRVGPGVLALRAYACGTSNRTPLFDLCLYGANNDLRGYEVGRYRDRAMVAAQGEYRFPIGGRFGGVVFGGWGKVAPSFGDMGAQPDLPAAGVGLRWLASEKARVNLSLDIARGRDTTSFYMYVKESF